MVNFTKKEKIGYGILAVGLIGSGLYSLFSGCGGGVAGTSGCYDTGITARIVGLLMIVGGGFLLRTTIKSPTVPQKDNTKE